MLILYIKSRRGEVQGTRAAGDRQKMIFLDNGDDGSVVRQEQQIHHDHANRSADANVALLEMMRSMIHR